jgi:hemerythrin
MALIWRDAMSIGNDVIDHDHRYLICYLNTVELALQTPDEGDILSSSLSHLYDYAYEHFMREEIIQQKINYPKLSDHQKEHKRLLSQLLQLQVKINSDYTKEDIENRFSELVSFLKHWMVDHVLNEDMQLKPYLLKHPKDLA